MIRRFLPVLALLIFLAGSVAGNQVYYEMDADEEDVDVNLSLKLECGDERCPHTWKLRWKVPENAEVLNVSDSLGKVDYTLDGTAITAESNQDNERDPAHFRIHYRVDREAEEVHEGLFMRELSLRSFSGAETSGRIHVDEFLSGWTDHGVETSIEGNNLTFRTEGPANIRVKFGDGYSTSYYEFFGGKPEDPSLAYEIPVGTLGQKLKFERLPVAILPDEKFNRTVSRWSAGEYVSGSAKMREGLEDNFLPVLTHETVHALNERELQWDSTSSAYFEEGTSRYVESLVRKKLYREGKIERPTRQLFGERVRFDPDPDDNYYSTVPSKGSADFLWGYYQNDRDFMKEWNPFDSPAEYRGFGYAYSELIIRNYISRMNGSVRDLYSVIDPDEKISSPDEKWEMFSRHLDMTPCKYDSRERFDRCLEEINSYNYTVFSAEGPIRPESGELRVRSLKLPEKEEQNSSGKTNRSSIELPEPAPDRKGLLAALQDVISLLFRDVGALLRGL